jgi:hypothetical protein
MVGPGTRGKGGTKATGTSPKNNSPSTGTGGAGTSFLGLNTMKFLSVPLPTVSKDNPQPDGDEELTAWIIEKIRACSFNDARLILGKTTVRC